MLRQAFQAKFNSIKDFLKQPKVYDNRPPKYLELKYTFIPILLIVVYLYYNVDSRVEVYVQNGFFARSSYYLNMITHFGLALYVLIPLGLIALAKKFIQRKNISVSFSKKLDKIGAYAWFLIATVAISGIVGQILKFVIGRARPKLFLEHGSQYFQHFHMPGYDFASMPSGHSITVAAFYAGLIYILPRFRVLWVFLALLIAFSRVALGSHYPSDVVFGLAVGSYTTIFIYYWMKNRAYI